MDTLFTKGNSRMISAFPLRLVYMVVGETDIPVPAQVLVSVSKRHFKHAVKRNRVKRQIREAYRRNKHILLGQLADFPEKRVAMAFIWQSGELDDSAHVEAVVVKLLSRAAEMICRKPKGDGGNITEERRRP